MLDDVPSTVVWLWLLACACMPVFWAMCKIACKTYFDAKARYHNYIITTMKEGKVRP